MKHALILLVTGAMAVVGFSQPAAGGNNNHNVNVNNARHNADEMKKLNTAVDTAHKSLDTARKKAGEEQKQLSEAKAEVGKVTAAARKEFESNPEMKQAIDAAAAAHKNYDAACEPVLLKLKDKSEYKAALAAKDKAVQEKDEGLKDSSTSDQQRGKLISAVADAATAVSKIEQDALAADPECARLKKVLDDATATANKLRADLEAKLKDDPRVVAARQKIAPAEKEHNSAASAVSDAEKSYNTAVQRRNAEEARIRNEGIVIQNTRNTTKK